MLGTAVGGQAFIAHEPVVEPGLKAITAREFGLLSLYDVSDFPEGACCVLELSQSIGRCLHPPPPPAPREDGTTRLIIPNHTDVPAGEMAGW